jgi:outer membrane murein-binding lipoprotein Lpp
MNSKYTINSLMLTSIVLATAMTAGCASGPTRVEDDFGNSVRAMNQAQILDPVAAAAPDTTAITSTDGVRMENALKGYRDSVGKSEAVNEDFNFDVDN